MADKRISQLIERTDIANNDVLPIVASGATITNKVTISTIQNWMQDNLDVGVTSVGITIGSTGTDVNVTGSPITTSGNITINIPTASATNRGLLSAADWSNFNSKQVAGDYVTTDTTQTVTGQKTFSGSSLRLAANGTADEVVLRNVSGTTGSDSGATTMGFNGNDNLFISTQSRGGFILVFNNSVSNREYTLPDASGTLALTSDLGGYVTLGTAQTITATKTFTTSGSGNTINVNHTSGSGHGVEIQKSGNGEGLRVIKTSGSGNAVTISGGLLSAEAATFTGNVGIGASPIVRLQVQDSANTYVSHFSGLNQTNGIAFGTNGSNVAVIQGYTRTFSATNNIAMQVDGGNLGLGTTSPSYQLQLSTDSAAKPTSALWTIASDERIKENITPYEKGLEDLMKINPVNYDYNGLGGFTKGKGGVGIIAQEIAEVLPDSVNSFKGKLHEEDEEETEILNFNGHELIYVLINSVKDLKAEIEALKSQING